MIFMRGHDRTYGPGSFFGRKVIAVTEHGFAVYDKRSPVTGSFRQDSFRSGYPRMGGRRDRGANARNSTGGLHCLRSYPPAFPERAGGSFFFNRVFQGDLGLTPRSVGLLRLGDWISRRLFTYEEFKNEEWRNFSGRRGGWIYPGG